jgi:serine/threonine protein kinase
MAKLNEQVILQTAFREYTIDEQIGEGGAGRVFAGTDDAGNAVAIKVLSQSSADKKRRFKNEIAFLASHKHRNLVSVIDYGVAVTKVVSGPFYVMRRYDASLRSVMADAVAPDRALQLFSQMLDGVEAAHLVKVVHRDLKPENFLYIKAENLLAVADFGVAAFTEATLQTLVETDPKQRLANFMYAAPEQRRAGQAVSCAADIYALGLMLNELFTRTVPLGTDYRTIEATSKEHGYLDGIVARMIKQTPGDRPQTIAEVKTLIQKYRNEAVSLQRLSAITQTVIPAGEVDEPLAHEPPRLIDACWENGILTLVLDRPVNQDWIYALKNMGSHTSVLGKGPEMFSVNGTEARISANEHDAQSIINYFKAWLPQVTRVLKQNLEARIREEDNRRKEQLRRDREAEEKRLRINQSLRV